VISKSSTGLVLVDHIKGQKVENGLRLPNVCETQLTELSLTEARQNRGNGEERTREYARKFFMLRQLMFLGIT
jgi:hypothetical protein